MDGEGPGPGGKGPGGRGGVGRGGPGGFGGRGGPRLIDAETTQTGGVSGQWTLRFLCTHIEAEETLHWPLSLHALLLVRSNG